MVIMPNYLCIGKIYKYLEKLGIIIKVKYNYI